LDQPTRRLPGINRCSHSQTRGGSFDELTGSRPRDRRAEGGRRSPRRRLPKDRSPGARALGTPPGRGAGGGPGGRRMDLRAPTVRNGAGSTRRRPGPSRSDGRADRASGPGTSVPRLGPKFRRLRSVPRPPAPGVCGGHRVRRVRGAGGRRGLRSDRRDPSGGGMDVPHLRLPAAADRPPRRRGGWADGVVLQLRARLRGGARGVLPAPAGSCSRARR